MTPLETPCVIWPGGRHHTGYGIVKRNGRQWRAHRWVWTQANGPIPPGLVVMHLCDNPPCVNVDHLRLGTVADNHADMMSKTRHPRMLGQRNGSRTHPERLRRGSQNPAAKLTESDLPVIMARLSRGEPQRVVAADYGVTQSAISLLVRGINWKGAPK